MPSKVEKQSSSDLQTVFVVTKTYYTNEADNKAAEATRLLAVFTDGDAAQKYANEYMNHVSLTHGLYPNETSEMLSELAHRAGKHSQTEPPGKKKKLYLPVGKFSFRPCRGSVIKVMETNV